MCYTLIKADSTTCSSLVSTDLVAASGVPSDLYHTTLNMLDEQNKGPRPISNWDAYFTIQGLITLISGRNEWAQSGCRRPSAQPPGEACQASIGEGQTGRGGSSALHSFARGHSPGELLRPASSCFVVASMTMHSCAASRAMPGIIFSILSVASDVRPILRCSRVLRIVGRQRSM